VGWQRTASIAAYRGGWSAVRYLPEPAAYRLFDGLADAAWRRGTKGSRRLRANLARVAAPGTDLDALARAGMRSYMRYWCEVFRLPDWDTDRVVSRLRLVDEHNLLDPLAAGAGLVGALPHMGNWDHGGAGVAARGVRLTSVAERLEPAEVFEQFVAFRESLGMHIVPLSGGDVDVFATLADRVRHNHFVPLLADRDLTARGLPVTFFGERASMPAGPAALALRTRAPLVPVTLWYEGTPPHHNTVLRFGEPLEVPRGRGSDVLRTVTQALATAFEAGIREHPADWHMLQRLFAADLAPRPV
jgi:KDO2-lipid IV(A) lauroyltransferase